MLSDKSSQAAPAVADATRIARSPSVLAAEVDGEIVMMSIEQGLYFGLDDIGSDIWKRIDPPCLFADLSIAWRPTTTPTGRPSPPMSANRSAAWSRKMW